MAFTNHNGYKCTTRLMAILPLLRERMASPIEALCNTYPFLLDYLPSI